MSRRHRPGRAATPGLASLAIAAGLALAACGLTAPGPTSSPPNASRPTPGASPSPSAPGGGQPTAAPDNEAVYAAIEAQVVKLRGLQPKSPVEPHVLNKAEIKALVETSFEKDNPDDVVAANERLLKGLGLLPRDASLGDLFVELMGSNVAGLYSPDEKQLYVVSKTGTLGPIERVTFAHEFTHALQDQNFNLNALDIANVGEGDRGLARLALVEGDATAVMTFWSQQHLTPDETVELLRSSLDPEALAILEKMPPVLRDTLAFPYDAGLQFAVGLQSSGGWQAVDDAIRAPPASTEQILHPETYAAREAPIAVDLPDDLAARMGAGWKSSLEDTLGEFQLRLWLRGGTNRVPDATGAAAGWGGDRVVLLDGPDGAWAIGLLTDWDSAADAAEFADAANQRVGGLDTPGTVGTPAGSTRVVVVIGSDVAAATNLDSLIGQTGV